MKKTDLQIEMENVRRLTPEAFAKKFDEVQIKTYMAAGSKSGYKRAKSHEDILLAFATDLQLTAAVKKFYQETLSVPDLDMAVEGIERLWDGRAELIREFGLGFNADKLSPEAMLGIGKSIVEQCQFYRAFKEGDLTERDFGDLAHRA